MTEIAFSSVKIITGGQLPGVRGIRGGGEHLLHTIAFLVLLRAQINNTSFSW